jgi:hypothetical protein
MKNKLTQFAARSRVLLQRLVRLLSSWAWEDEIKVYRSPAKEGAVALEIVKELAEKDKVGGGNAWNATGDEIRRAQNYVCERLYPRIHRLVDSLPNVQAQR